MVEILLMVGARTADVPLLRETDPMLSEDMQRLLEPASRGKVEASVARRLRTPPKSANP